MLRIDADLLIPGRGEPVRDGCVVLDGPAEPANVTHVWKGGVLEKEPPASS